MEFLLKKDGSKKTTISEKELIKLLNIDLLREQIQKLEARVAELEKVPIIDKKHVLSLIDSDILKKGDVLNISHASSIEKMNNISIGAVYYNANKSIRLKTEEGWVTIKIK